MSQRNDEALKARALKVIPKGMYGHLAANLLPASFPQFVARAKGAYIWDADDNRYLDFMCAWGPNLLGYADPRVDRVAIEQLAKGDTTTGPAPIMVDLAEALVGMVTHADWAMFCKNGTDATTMARTTARAQTGRRIVLVAEGSYHGCAPWNTSVSAPGILPEDGAFMRYYTYNDVASLEAAVAEAGDDLAAVFATPFRHDIFRDQELPLPVYARRARELCDRTGALLVVDDIRAGFRLAKDCSWSLVGVEPDLSCWGKSLANGHALSVLLGSERCREAAGAIVVTGSFWFSAVPMAAAVETLRILRETDYVAHLQRLGAMLREGLDAAAAQHGFELYQSGPVQMPQILFVDDLDYRLGFAWSEEMLARGVYMHPWHNMFLCVAMTEDDIAFALDAARAAFAAVAARRGAITPHPVLAGLIASRPALGALIQDNAKARRKAVAAA